MSSLGPLQTLDGRAVPQGFPDDLLRLAGLSAEALAEVWTVLGPSLREELDPRLDEVLTAYGKRFGVAESELALGLKAARFLLREAARRALPFEKLAEDLALLLGEERARPFAKVVSERYSEAIEAVRHEMIRGALLDHGSVLVGVDWRIDTINASQRGLRMSTPVVLLTLRTKVGDREERVTVQALPDVLDQLRTSLDDLLGRRGG